MDTKVQPIINNPDWVARIPHSVQPTSEGGGKKARLTYPAVVRYCSSMRLYVRPFQSNMIKAKPHCCGCTPLSPESL